MAKKNEQTYESAFEALQVIMQDIETGEISIDILSEKIKEAAELLKFCKQKLKATENDVSKLLEQLDED